LHSPYGAGARNFNWVKLKRHAAGALQDTIDCVLLGYIFGRGKRAALGAGALLVGVYDPKQDMFVTVSKIGTGLTDEEWRSIRERTKELVVDHKPARVSSLIEPTVWLEPEMVLKFLPTKLHVRQSIPPEKWEMSLVMPCDFPDSLHLERRI